MEESYIGTIIDTLKKAILEKDPEIFDRAYFKLAGVCRKYILNADRPLISKAYPELLSLLTWFYSTGKPQWPEVDRRMGGLDALLGLMGEQRHFMSSDQALDSIKASPGDQKVLLALGNYRDGLLSGSLAELLNVRANALTNRLPGLEKKGLIQRFKRGKNSLVFLTPKGRTVASKLIPDTGHGKKSGMQSSMENSTNPQGNIDLGGYTGRIKLGVLPMFFQELPTA